MNEEQTLLEMILECNSRTVADELSALIYRVVDANIKIESQESKIDSLKERIKNLEDENKKLVEKNTLLSDD